MTDQDEARWDEYREVSVDLEARTTSLSMRLVDAAASSGLTLAVAESLTGGLVCDAIVRIHGASRVFRGGIIAYSSEIKSAELGVDPDLLSRHGAVVGLVAQQMAAGVRDKLGADIAIATTGVAGPAHQDGKAPGTVYIAAGRTGYEPQVRELALTGDRDAIRRATVLHALELTLELL